MDYDTDCSLNIKVHNIIDFGANSQLIDDFFMDWMLLKYFQVTLCKLQLKGTSL